MNFRNLAFGMLCGLILAISAVSTQAAEDTPTPAPSYAGEKACLKCHDDDRVMAIQGTPHSVTGDPRTPAATNACESCHGASAEHAASRPAKGEKKVLATVIFEGPDASPAEARSAVCLTCHQDSGRRRWKGSAHADNDVACNTCHTVHARKDPVREKATEVDKCFTCHAQQRAESFQMSHHPMREGKVVCSDCHNVHGSAADAQLVERDVNKTCYNCHAEKRGPYAYEHAPVRENCLNCHSPHGTNQVALLIERQPFLCQTCHDNNHQRYVQSGATLPGSSAYNPTTINGALALPATTGAINMVGRSCAECHSQVHGSNSPAGKNLTR